MLTFNMWLFVIKHLGQTPDMAETIYNQLGEEEKARLNAEYDEYKKSC